MIATPSMPKEIATAVLLVMRAVGKIAKDSKNNHGNYAYTNIDAFLEVCNPACAEAGLIIMPVELSSEAQTVETVGNDGKVKASRQIVFAYNFMLIHESGATWCNERDVRHVAVQAVGAQAYGSAQSYALKQYMRSLFLIPTGDPDADAQSHMQATMIRATVSAAKAKRETGKDHTSIDFGNGVEIVELAAVPDRVMAHLETFADQSDAMQWWESQSIGRAQLYEKAPKVAMELKRKVEHFFNKDEAA